MNTFGKIAGYENEKNELAGLQRMLHHAEEYREHGVRIPRGIVLTGVPGIGKSVLAKSIADKGIGSVILRTAANDESSIEEELRKAFETAKKKAPCVLVLDDIDKVAGTSCGFYMEDNNNVKKRLLRELDELKDEDTVLVVATCNDAGSLGSALLRPGRFDRVIKMDLPDENTRRLILTKYLKKLKIRKKSDLEYVARITYGYTGAMLECLVNEVGILAMEKEEPCICNVDFRTAMNRIAFSGGEKEPPKDYSELRKTAVHEAGHAIVALKLWPECLHGASVIPQGDSNGHVNFIPDESVEPTLEQLEKRVAVLLGGRVAERVVLGCQLVGSGSDLNSALSALYTLVVCHAAYGYSHAVLSLCFNGTEMSVSDRNKYETEKKVEERMNAMDELAKKIITENRRTYDVIVSELMEKKVLSRADLLRIYNETSDIPAVA